MNLKALRTAATLSFSVALAGMMFAQSSPSSQPGTPRQGGLQSMDGQTVTVTGCLVKATDLPGAAASPAGGATAGATASAGTDFALANVQMRSTSPSGTTAGGTGAAGAGATTGAPSGPRGMNLKLKASDSDKLSEHVNKQVEVTGRLSIPAAGAAGATAGTTPSPTTGTPGTPAGAAAAGRAAASGLGQMGQLDVQSIRATGQSCTPSGQ